MCSYILVYVHVLRHTKCIKYDATFLSIINVKKFLLVIRKIDITFDVDEYEHYDIYIARVDG